MIAYALGFVFLLVLFLLMEQPFLLAFLVLYFAVACILLPLFFLSYRKLSFQAYSRVSSVDKGNDIPFAFSFINPSFSPFFLCRVRFTLKNLYLDNSNEHDIAVHVLPKQTQTITVPVETSHIGIVKAEIQSVSATDLLHFFTMTLPYTPVVEVPVFPEITPNEDLPETPSADGIDEYTESDAKGNISSDIREIRQYQPGDRLQRIHWKLSAKLDDLFVKEMAHTSILSLVLLPELTKEEIEPTVSNLLGCIKTLQDREERFEVGLFNAAAVDFSFLTMVDESAVIEALIRLFYLPLYEEKETALDAFTTSGIKKATVISICGDDIKIIPAEL